MCNHEVAITALHILEISKIKYLIYLFNLTKQKMVVFSLNLLYKSCQCWINKTTENRK